MAIQNEPAIGLQDHFPWNTMGFTPEMERDFVKNDLGPTLEAAGWDQKSSTLSYWIIIEIYCHIGLM